MFSARRVRQGDSRPLRILVLTFNRTLAGYVRKLAEHQIASNVEVVLEIETFARWAMLALNFPDVQANAARAKLHSLAAGMPSITPDYVVKEVEYLLGRFEPARLEDYITSERTGRGPLPRVDRHLRRQILDKVVYPYQQWLIENNTNDWNNVAVQMANNTDSIGYDIAVIYESQDFSANQLRAIRHHLLENHAVTFVIDTVQRIYARGFTWSEAGYDIRSDRVHKLRENHRNTLEIATFAAAILNGIGVEGDGALPNLAGATSSGPRPVVLVGRYNRQVNWAIDYISRNVNLNTDSVAFLKPKAGAWFDTIKSHLVSNGIGFVDITREADWPDGMENVALSTFHSAKGLEFDYVFILGFNQQNTPYAVAELDDEVFVLRRLLAVAVARARKAVVIGYKPGEESQLVQNFVSGTYNQVIL